MKNYSKISHDIKKSLRSNSLIGFIKMEVTLNEPDWVEFATFVATASDYDISTENECLWNGVTYRKK